MSKRRERHRAFDPAMTQDLAEIALKGLCHPALQTLKKIETYKDGNRKTLGCGTLK